MDRLFRRLVVIAVTAAFLAALGLVTPPGDSGWVGPESADAAALPQPGKRGTAVRSLQKRLVDAGYLRAQYRTGYYGARTEKAVKALQKAYHLKATGRMTKATDRALTKALGAMTKPRTWYHSEVIGRSQSGRRITAYRAGEPGKPVVVVMATMHGEEDFGQYVAYGLMEGRPITGIDLWVLPVVNPDGLAKDRRWVNGHVDLNRNFPYSWVKRANSGPRAVSERETTVIMQFLTRTKPRYLVSWHQPLRGVDTDKVKDLALSKRLAKNLQLPLKELDCGGVCHGTMTAWYNHTFAGSAVTVEYGSAARTTRRMKTEDADAVLVSVGGRRG
ncbi:MAG TPA: M14 family zinc carboxypeptidase [Microlunatus sp.]|nr:M14 family zinc carboxypeptidase [Microlunatus sp.]